MLQLKALEKYRDLEPFLISALFVFLYILTFTGNPDYDPIRNLIVSQEIQERGIPTYFDSAYWQHPPLLNYMIALTSSLFGITLYLAGKIVILAFSFLSLFVFYKLCLEFKDRTFARLATSIFAATPVFWVWSNQIMHEVPQTFFFIATAYFFYLAVKRSANKYFYFAGIFLGLAMLTKSQAVIVVPVMLAYLWVEKGKTAFIEKTALKSIFIMFLIAGMVYSPYFLYRTVNNAPSLFGEEAFKELVTGKAAWAPTGDISVPFYYYITSIFDIISFGVVFFAAGLVYIYRKKDRTMLLPVLWVGFSYLILSLFSHKVYRYMIIAIPAMAMISAYGISAITEHLKDRRYFYAVTAILVLSLSAHSIYLAESAGVYWPKDWGMWNELKNLNNSVISTDLNKYSSVRMSYGMIKLMTGKYSDIITGDPRNDISFALMYNTPYLLYDGKPEFEYPYIKMKYFGECNCTLYKIDEPFLYGNKTLVKTTSEGNVLKGANIYIADVKGNVVYRSKSNINGEVFIPAENYEGVLIADKICYNPVQTYIKIENGTFNACDVRQRANSFGMPENYLECRQKQNIDLSGRGCFNHGYQASRF